MLCFRSLKRLLFGLLAALMSQAAGADAVSWEPYRGLLAKDGYSTASAQHVVHSESGANRLTLTLSHAGTSRNLFSYSKWEIDRWGDPEGARASRGAWQLVSNAANDVVLGIWGYWGWDGAETSLRVAPDEATSYELTLEFERPVCHLRLPVHGINALFTPNQFNSVDEMQIDAFAGEVSVDSVILETLGDGVFRQSPGVRGNIAKPMGAKSNAFDGGSLLIRIDDAIDRLVLRFTNRALQTPQGHFTNDHQAWSFSLGNLVFENEAVPFNRKATAIEWLARKGALHKPGFTPDTATTSITSKDGLVRLDLTLEHVKTTPGLTSFSKWEIDRWGDPESQLFGEGSWQVVSNAANDVVLGLWGYWGGEGETVTMGDVTSYRLAMRFDEPVHDLALPLYGINGFINATNGYNSADELGVEGFLGGTPAPAPRYENLGPAMTERDGILLGDFRHQIDDGISGQHMSDDGACTVVFSHPVDRVVLTLINRAGHADPAQFRNGLQTWSLSVGDMRFTHGVSRVNLARGPETTVTQSSTLHPQTPAERAIDGSANGNFWDQSVSVTAFEDQPWLTLDLGAVQDIDELVLWSGDEAWAQTLEDLVIFLSREPFTSDDPTLTETQEGVFTWSALDFGETRARLVLEASGRYLRVQRRGSGILSLAEIEVLGNASQGSGDAPLVEPDNPVNHPHQPSPNPFLDQLGYFALISTDHPAGVGVEAAEDGVDLFFQRPPALDALLEYTLQLSPDLVTWTSFPIEQSALFSLRLPQVDLLVPDLRERGLARLRIAVKGGDAVTFTKAVGWYRTAGHQGFQTHGLSLNRPPLAAGRVLHTNGGFRFTFASPAPFTVDEAAYAEVMDGIFEGHRIEIGSVAPAAPGQWLVEGIPGGTTTLEQITHGLTGAAIALRPHWTLKTAYPPERMQPARDLSLAGQILFFQEDHYQTAYSLTRPDGSTQWTAWGDTSLQDRGSDSIVPGQGVFVFLPRDEPLEILVAGHVRDHRFRQPLVPGSQLICEGFPLLASPLDRRLVSEDIVSGAEPSTSDGIHLWAGDQDPARQFFESLFYFGPLHSSTAPYWVAADDTALASRNAETLFRPDRAVFLQLAKPLADYYVDPVNGD